MPHDLAVLDRFAVGRYQPSTFLERGVAVPFTTPILLGARLRPAERRGMELIIPNPGGGQGVYILPWSAMPDICSPTLHDRRLWSVLSEQPVIAPSAVREVTLAIAAEGFAGHHACTAAAKSREARIAARVRTNFLLLLSVIRHTESPAEAQVPPARDTPANIEARARRALARLAPRLGWETEEVVSALEDIAAFIHHLGLPDDPLPGAVRRQIQDIRRTADEIAIWYAGSPAAQDQRVGDVIAEVVALTLRCCQSTLAELDALLSNPEALLREWRRDAAALRAIGSRPEWLVDGWGFICALWADAPDSERLAVTWEIALIVPLIPREAEDWTTIHADWERPALLRRRVRALEDWRTGRQLDLTERHERALALVA
jgi:hypothetical protein